jgi:hypothetical protein
MKRGSSALLPLGQLVGGRKVVKLPSGVDTRRIGRFPQLQRDPPPRDGVMYRSAGDGDHVVVSPPSPEPRPPTRETLTRHLKDGTLIDTAHTQTLSQCFYALGLRAGNILHICVSISPTCLTVRTKTLSETQLSPSFRGMCTPLHPLNPLPQT